MEWDEAGGAWLRRIGWGGRLELCRCLWRGEDAADLEARALFTLHCKPAPNLPSQRANQLKSE